MSADPLGRATTFRRGSIAARGWRVVLAPVVVVATGACFATRSDVQLLQSDIGTLRAEQTRRDSARGAQLDRVLAALGTVSDSLRTTSGRVAKLQGDVQGDLYSMGQQLIQIQELTGQSQRRLQELRAGLEERAQPAAPLPGPTPAGAPAVSGGGTSTAAPAATPVTPTGPGPNQLYQLSLDQLRRGSAAAARAGFQDLLRQYPTSDLAPDASFYIAESWASSGNSAAADSVYQVVVARYPESPRASTALYKHALILLRGGRTAPARTTLQDVVSKYPRSDEAELARERLRTLR